MELWVVTALLSLSLPLMSLLRLARAGEQKCFVYEEKLSRLIGLPYLLRRDSLLCRIVSPPPLPPQASAPFLVVEYFQGKRGSKCNYGGGRGGNLRYLRPFKKTLSHQLRPTFLDIL